MSWIRKLRIAQSVYAFAVSALLLAFALDSAVLGGIAGLVLCGAFSVWTALLVEAP